MPTPASSPGLELGYHASRASRRHVARRLILPAVVLTAAFAAWRMWPPFASHVNLLGLQRRCLAYTPAPGRVVYDDDPARVAALASAPGYAGSHPSLPRPSGTFAVYENPAFRSYRRGGAAPGRPVAPPAFLGRLRSPAGNERLVAVSLSLVP